MGRILLNPSIALSYFSWSSNTMAMAMPMWVSAVLIWSRPSFSCFANLFANDQGSIVCIDCLVVLTLQMVCTSHIKECWCHFHTISSTSSLPYYFSTTANTFVWYSNASLFDFALITQNNTNISKWINYVNKMSRWSLPSSSPPSPTLPDRSLKSQ